MAVEAANVLEPSVFARAWGFALSRHWTFRAGCVMLTLLLLSIVFADVVAPHSPSKQNLETCFPDFWSAVSSR